MTIETLNSPNPRNRNSISVIKSKFLSVFSMKICSPFWKLLTRDVTSNWQADCTTDFLGDTSHSLVLSFNLSAVRKTEEKHLWEEMYFNLILALIKLSSMCTFRTGTKYYWIKCETNHFVGKYFTIIISAWWRKWENHLRF